MNIKNLLVKAILLYKQDGIFYFLELTRSPRKSFCPLMGDLPGGKVDTGELPIAAIKREIQEETGIVVSNLHQIIVYDWENSQEYREYFYCAMVDIQEVVLAPEEHISYRWIALDKINELTLHPNVKKIIEREKELILKLVSYSNNPKISNAV